MSTVRQGLSIIEFVELFDAGSLSLETSHEFSVEQQIPPIDAPPQSATYADWVFAVWSQITGRANYDALVDEAFDVPFDQFLRQPYPYSSGSPVEVGNYLGAIAWFLQTVAPCGGQKVVEYGSGWGHLALHLAMMGCDVVAVDLNEPSALLLEERAKRWGVPLTVARSTFLDFDAPESDLIVFFESFHHCADPFALLDRCRAQLRPGGRLAFLADAIYEGFYCPWGVRLDGSATFMARQVGWLELGFEQRFFFAELDQRGFEIECLRVDYLGAYGSLIVATLR